MKPVNLHSILEASQSLSANEYNQYLSFYGIKKPKDVEIEALSLIIHQLEEKKAVDFNHFYIGFQIEQISSEFDLIRIGRDKTINIEIKKEATKEVVINQLRRSRYYLNVLDSELLTYTFLSDMNLLYKFTSEEELIQVDMEELASELNSQQVEISTNINDLFEPSRYLVSPFNSTRKFLDGQYFLTNPQEDKKREFFRVIDTDCKFIGVKGEPGTGKTLMTYDIAKDLQSKGYKVLLIFCAELNIGHRKLISKGWHIKSIKEFKLFCSSLENYDFIFIDEAQRIYTNQFNEIVDYVNKSSIKCIFSYDPKQCFSDYEFSREIPKKIENECSAHILALSKKIRANKELTAFVNNFFYLRNGSSNSNIVYSNINVLYFSNIGNAKKAIRQYIDDEWEVINYTPSRFNAVSYDAYQYSYNENIHKNIGQEFDYVLGVIDHNFYYDVDGRLTSRRVSGSPGYDLDKMLYQILTRARKKITLLIINNKDVFTKCMKILGHH